MTTDADEARALAQAWLHRTTQQGGCFIISVSQVKGWAPMQ
jgi:hypothetical protein